MLDSDADSDAMAEMARAAERPARTDERPAIIVDNVSKRFRLYRERASSLKETITSRRGKRARYEEFWALRDVSVTDPEGLDLRVHRPQRLGEVDAAAAHGRHPPADLGHRDHRRPHLRPARAGRRVPPRALRAARTSTSTARSSGLTRREVERGARRDHRVLRPRGLHRLAGEASTRAACTCGSASRSPCTSNPEILIIDEVIAVGDEEFQRRCFDYIYQLRRQGVTIVMVSHGAPLMEQMCDEVAWLDHGQLMAKGDPSEVVRKYLEKVNVVENERLSNTAEVPVVDNDEIVVDTAVRRGGQSRDRDHRLRAPRRIRARRYRPGAPATR